MTIADLWLAILLSAVFVFIASSIIHMVLPIHRGDYGKLPNEGKVLEALRKEGVKPGHYMFPCGASMKDMGSPEMIEKMKLGPVGFATVMPNGPHAMGKSLLTWFVYSIVVGVFAAYVTTLAPGADAMVAFRITASVAFLAYAGSIMDSIWKGVSWSISAKFIFDAVIYCVVTGAAFAWCWPTAA